MIWELERGGISLLARDEVDMAPSERNTARLNRWRRPWLRKPQTSTHSLAFERTSKRRKGFPSETNVKRGHRFIRGGEVELVEKLGRNDPCLCGSGRSFQEVLPQGRQVSTGAIGMIIGGETRFSLGSLLEIEPRLCSPNNFVAAAFPRQKAILHTWPE